MATSEHFQEAELACPCCGVNGVQQPVLDAAEAIRSAAEQRYGKVRVKTTSAYRCPAHNAAIVGSVKSQHMLGTALDIRLQAFKWNKFLNLKQWVTIAPCEWEDLARQAGVGGYGRDDERQFAHIDTRDKVAQWCYKSYAHPQNSTKKFYRECAYYSQVKVKK